MNSTLDYIGSAIVAGMVVLIILTLNSNIVTSSFQRNMDMVSQEAAVNLMNILETDLKRIGYFHAGSRILVASRERVKFQGDVDDDGTPDIVMYHLGDSTAYWNTKNPRDRPLYRRVGTSDSLNVASGLVRFSFSYKDSLGSTIPYDSLALADVRERIRILQIDFRVEPPEPADSTFIPVEIKRLIAPKNLLRW